MTNLNFVSFSQLNHLSIRKANQLDSQSANDRQEINRADVFNDWSVDDYQRRFRGHHIIQKISKCVIYDSPPLCPYRRPIAAQLEFVALTVLFAFLRRFPQERGLGDPIRNPESFVPFSISFTRLKLFASESLPSPKPDSVPARYESMALIVPERTVITLIVEVPPNSADPNGILASQGIEKELLKTYHESHKLPSLRPNSAGSLAPRADGNRSDDFEDARINHDQQSISDQ
jgi:hypothetical protein